MVTGSRPARVASFGGRKSFVPANAPKSNAEAEIFHVKKSVWESTDDPVPLRWRHHRLPDRDPAVRNRREPRLPHQPQRPRRTPPLLRDRHPRHGRGRFRPRLPESHRPRRPPPGRPRLHPRHSDEGARITGPTSSCAATSPPICGASPTASPSPSSTRWRPGIAAMALDQARTTGQVVDLTDTWGRTRRSWAADNDTSDTAAFIFCPQISPPEATAAQSARPLRKKGQVSPGTSPPPAWKGDGGGGHPAPSLQPEP